MEVTYDLSHLKFDGEGNTFILEHTLLFLNFCDFHEINWEEVVCTLFILTL